MTERDSIMNDCDSVDRISDLPDSILGLILSFLSIQDAIDTSVLSKRWKFAWLTIHNLHFFYHSGIERMKFIRYVNHVLLLHDGGLLNKFSLFWNCGCISSHVTSWVNTAITKNVQELSLSLRPFDGPFEMPTSVFNCNSLRSLDLSGHIQVSAAIPLFLPRLETLKVRGVDKFWSEEAFENFIRGSPMLNYLYLQVDYNDGFTFRISSTSLRRVKINSWKRFTVMLNTSSLEYLMVHGPNSEVIVQNNLSSLVEVDFGIMYEEGSCNSIVEAVRAFDRAKFLTFTKDVLMSLRNATIGLSTEFRRLVELNIESGSTVLHSKKCRALTVNQCNSLEEVARCLSNSLRTVLVNCDPGYYKVDRETIRYFLKHGSALELMVIYDLVVYRMHGEDGGNVEDSATTKWVKVRDGRNVEDSATSEFVNVRDGRNVEDGRIVADSASSKLVKEISEFPRKSPICVVKFE